MSINYELVKQINVPTLEQILNTIITLINPDKIILFGSYARGDNHAKSDVDLLIMKKKIENGGDVIDTVEMALLKQNIGTDLSIVPVQTDRFYELKDVVGYVYHDVHREGKVLYETIYWMDGKS